MKEQQDEIERLKAQISFNEAIEVSRNAQIALSTVVRGTSAGFETPVTSGSAALRGLTTTLITEFKEQAAATKE